MSRAKKKVAAPCCEASVSHVRIVNPFTKVMEEHTVWVRRGTGRLPYWKHPYPMVQVSDPGCIAEIEAAVLRHPQTRPLPPNPQADPAAALRAVGRDLLTARANQDVALGLAALRRALSLVGAA